MFNRIKQFFNAPQATKTAWTYNRREEIEAAKRGRIALERIAEHETQLPYGGAARVRGVARQIADLEQLAEQYGL